MHVYWTLTPAHGGFNVGLWATAAEGQAVIDRHELVSYDLAVAPVYATGLPGQLADRLAVLGIAHDVLDGFDGTALACKHLSDALRDAAYKAGLAENAAWEARLRFELAGRICFWCGRVATVAGYGDGEARLACDKHALELDSEVHNDERG